MVHEISLHNNVFNDELIDKCVPLKKICILYTAKWKPCSRSGKKFDEIVEHCHSHWSLRTTHMSTTLSLGGDGGNANGLWCFMIFGRFPKDKSNHYFPAISLTFNSNGWKLATLIFGSLFSPPSQWTHYKWLRTLYVCVYVSEAGGGEQVEGGETVREKHSSKNRLHKSTYDMMIAMKLSQLKWCLTVCVCLPAPSCHWKKQNEWINGPLNAEITAALRCHLKSFRNN